MSHSPPEETLSLELHVVRDDGTLFGPAGDQPLQKLGFAIKLPQLPTVENLWSASGVKAYRAGYRVDPREVFARLVVLFDRFVAFERSLASQKLMCEFSACYATWMLDGCTAFGYLWVTGSHGSGQVRRAYM